MENKASFFAINHACIVGKIKIKSTEDKHFSNVLNDTYARIFGQCLDNLKNLCVYRWGLPGVRGNFDTTCENWYSG
jgi:hypothetical protein